jgi:hypothetical protein
MTAEEMFKEFDKYTEIEVNKKGSDKKYKFIVKDLKIENIMDNTKLLELIIVEKFM